MSKLKLKVKVVKRIGFYPIGIFCFLFKLKVPVNFMIKVKIVDSNINPYIKQKREGANNGR